MSATWQWAKANPDAAARRIRDLERENATLREQVEHLIGMIEQLESDLAHFATIEAFETKKEAKP
jgi:predicted nuclease with TOPRIM domain